VTDQLQRFFQTITPLTLFNLLYLAYLQGTEERSSPPKEESKLLTNPGKSGIIKSKRGERRRLRDLPPWIREISLKYGHNYLRGVTKEEGYKKLMEKEWSPEEERR